MNIDEDFAEFVGARWGSLYRLAYLLAASPTGAEDLLQTTLEKAYVNWSRIGGMEYAEAYVRRMLANTLVSSRRRAWIGEQPWGRAARDRGGLRRGAGPRPVPALAAGVRASRSAAGSDRAALLRGPERGADRRRPRLRAGHGEVTVVGGDRGTATGPGRVGHRGGGGRVMNSRPGAQTALSQEAELRTPPPPDVDGLIRGGGSRRRRNVARIGVGAAAPCSSVVPRSASRRSIRGPGTEPEIAGTPSPPSDAPSTPRPSRTRRLSSIPGTPTGCSSATTPLVADRGRPDPRRHGLDQREPTPAVRRPRPWAGVGVYQPERWRAVPAAPSTPPSTGRGRDPRPRARLARLPRSTVVQPPTATVAFGQGAHHLRLRIDVWCPGQCYRSEPTTGWGRGISYVRLPSTSSSTSGSWTWAGPPSWSTNGTTATRRRSWWKRLPGPATRSPS